MSTQRAGDRPLAPQRSTGRQRVASILDAAADVFAERGFGAATMAEVAARAEANIGSLYRFFPSKEVLAEAVMDHEQAWVEQAFDRIESSAPAIAAAVLADQLMVLMADLHRETRGLRALMEGDGLAQARQTRTRDWAIERIARVLQAHQPELSDRADVGDVAIVMLNGMKLMAAMTVEANAPTSPGAVEELRRMFRLYLTEQLNVRL